MNVLKAIGCTPVLEIIRCVKLSIIVNVFESLPPPYVAVIVQLPEVVKVMTPLLEFTVQEPEAV